MIETGLNLHRLAGIKEKRRNKFRTVVFEVLSFEGNPASFHYTNIENCIVKFM